MSNRTFQCDVELKPNISFSIKQKSYNEQYLNQIKLNYESNFLVLCQTKYKIFLVQNIWCAQICFEVQINYRFLNTLFEFDLVFFKNGFDFQTQTEQSKHLKFRLVFWTSNSLYLFKVHINFLPIGHKNFMCKKQL